MCMCGVCKVYKVRVYEWWGREREVFCGVCDMVCLVEGV